LPLAYLLARRRFRGQRLVEVLIDLPTVLPPAVAGLALLMAFGRRGLIGSWLQTLGIEIAFTPVAVMMAQMFVAAPYYIKTASVGLAGVSDDLECAAALDGAGTLQVLRYITLPLAWRGIVGGIVLCWARALGEFGATIIFAGNYPGRTQTMPLAVYLGFEIDLNLALTLGVILLVLSFGILLTVRAILRDEPDASNET
jgi:molybdate transport system permease protein